MVTLRIIESNTELSRRINQAIARELNSKIKSNKNKVVNRIKRAIPLWLESRPEIAELRSNQTPGSLNAQIGFPRGTADYAVDEIIDGIVQSIQVDVKDVTNSLKGGIEFAIQPASFTNLLSLPSSTFTTETGTTLEWLNWLLKLGTRTIVFGYSYTPDLGGRSGGGVMEGGGLWRINPVFAGTAEDNFITRAFENREKELANILRELF